MHVSLVEVQASTKMYQDLLQVAGQLEQAKYIIAHEPHIDESLLIGAFSHEQCIGFLRLVIQVIGREYARAPIIVAGNPLREGYVEAFGVMPACRRRGVGQRMQERAIELCRERGCYQIRSHSPITSFENYALKLKLGYAIQPSQENDSYYFINTLRQS